MAPSTSPRKIVPLASGDVTPRRSSPAPATTRRVFICGVVVEGSENGRRLSEDVQDLILSLGDPIGAQNDSRILPSASDASFMASSSDDRNRQRKRAMTDTSALADVINELVNTERSYVRRLRILKTDYADPLRQFSRSKSTAILPPYEAKTLFGNVDNLLPVNEAFLADLEEMIAVNGADSGASIGDVALKHFKDLRGFENYKQYYVKREEAQSIFEREMMKKSSGFAAFIDRIKYSTADTKNRVGLRELLMDPVQRIPRYTMLFRTMIKHMAPGDPQRAKLVEADEIASKIAQAEADEQTKRAAIMYCLSATIDGFPPGLISNSRRFIDCIDVEDIFLETGAPSSTSANGSVNSLHCSLFLFDDKVMVVKRPGNGDKSGRSLAGLDELNKMARTGGLPLGMKKSGMICKGVFDLTEVVAADAGGADIHIYFEWPPQDQSDRWLGRHFRALSVVIPPSSIDLDPLRTAAEKERFLDNLWNSQGKYRTKAGQSVVLRSEEREVESRGGKMTYARTYFNVYQRTAFLQEAKKTKIVMHIDPLGTADPIPFGIDGPPFVVVRVQPMAGELARYTVTSIDPNDDSEEDIVQTSRISGRIVQTIHQYGLFKFRTGNSSAPSTPTASMRSRAHIFSLDVISRNLFNALPGTSKGDPFTSSLGRKRSKSVTSRSSVYTQTTTADGSLAKFSYRSNSTITAATSLASMDDESFGGSKSSRSRSKTRKLVKRGRSPASDTDRSSVGRNSRSPSRERTVQYSDPKDNIAVWQKRGDIDHSDQDLSLRLELARRNSQNQHGKPLPPLSLDIPVTETIYEEEPPHPVRPMSRSSAVRDYPSQRSTTPTPSSSTPPQGLPSPHSRSNSQISTNRRRFGPRSPSPLPPKSPSVSLNILPPLDDESSLTDGTPTNAGHALETPPRTQNTSSSLPRSKRQPFLPMGNVEGAAQQDLSVFGTVNSVEPLSIKKKTSARPAHNAYTPTRRAHPKTSPQFKMNSRVVSPRRVSPQIRSSKVASTSLNAKNYEHLVQVAETTKEDLESSHRAVKRIKLEFDTLRTKGRMEESNQHWRPSSPDKSLVRTPQRSNIPLSKEAQQRMEEMRQLINKREGTPLIRQRSVAMDSPGLQNADSPSLEHLNRCDESILEADKTLTKVVSNYSTLHNDLAALLAEFKEKLSAFDKTRIELQNTKRQCELVKSLLADATAEKEIMYDAFNEELDAMFNDANLPEDEAWTAMTSDLRQTKAARNELSKESSQLKRRLAEVESEKEEWGALLRAHGLIP